MKNSKEHQEPKRSEDHVHFPIFTAEEFVKVSETNEETMLNKT